MTTENGKCGFCGGLGTYRRGPDLISCGHCGAAVARMQREQYREVWLATATAIWAPTAELFTEFVKTGGRDGILKWTDVAKAVSSATDELLRQANSRTHWPEPAQEKEGEPHEA